MSATSLEREDPVLVTGAAGKTGRAMIRRLVAAGRPVRAFVRREEQLREMEELGAGEVVVGDLEHEPALARAVGGAAAIHHICPNVHPREVEIGEKLVTAAREAAGAGGSGRFVYHSVLHPQVEAMPHHWAKMRVEELLFESGLEVTILQPAPYMQNVLAHWRSIVDRGVLPLPYSPATRVSMVDLEEVAEAATRVLTEPGHEGATYELCGPGFLDQHEIASELGRALGRPVQAEEVSRETWREQAAAAGLSAHAIDALLRMFRYYERYGLRGGSRVLEALLGRPPATFAEFADRSAAAR